jgi:hypothetical protein
MAILFKDRVRDTSTDTGTGTFTIANSAPSGGFQTFNAAYGTGSANKFYYCINGGNEWEVGIGYLSDSTTLVRETILGSSNSNSEVSFSAGTKDVFSTVAADWFGAVTVYPESTDFYITSSDDEVADYSIARNGTGVKSVANTPNTAQILVCGQFYDTNTNEYEIFQSYYTFDLFAAGLGADGTCTEASISLCIPDRSFATDNSVTDFTIEMRERSTWYFADATVYIPGGDLSALTLLASLTTAGLTEGAYFDLTENSTELRDAITAALAADGMLYVVLCSSRTTSNTAPSTSDPARKEYVALTCSRSEMKPKLVVRL